ncbi:exopolysaccharide biosynthesis protein [Marinobacter panjinensis]|uniref:Exopolysaccharide biosynthesis protein n=1 Tax=Marinobacter panjinensis TaxID=2576384 RepID=A0A4U6R7R7_9GAMM|nr:exopolysaccharide biosynthesis protein [Marinobacter panjinensis]MCR8916172.1 exopolysaccharide biosynthesis protein [Marinobacter panjinensis]TKV68356.1 exopolysaccharide biosynthesis protein [Marinobacter panjinensis]
MEKTRNDATNLQQLLGQIRESAGSSGQVSVNDILSGVGERSFGPVLLLAGLITLAPLIGDIPGVPTILGLIVLLTLGQLLFQRHSIWLPSWISQRSVPRDKLLKGLDWLQKPARFLDRWTGPRLVFLVDGPGLYVMATLCMLVAMAMPAMEVVPFSANGAGAALMAFGLAIVARDGLLAVVATSLTLLTGWFVITGLLG